MREIYFILLGNSLILLSDGHITSVISFILLWNYFALLENSFILHSFKFMFGKDELIGFKNLQKILSDYIVAML